MMSEPDNNRSIEIKESAVGSAIVSGDGNTIYVIQQSTEQKRVETEPQGSSDIGPNPYKGLAAFKELDADRYYGREAQIERLWQRFQLLYKQSEVPRFLPILGPSGCGKSSLARAGFIPELARKPLPGKEQMRVAVLVPGARPLEALAGVLAKAVTDDPFPVEKAEEFERVLKKSNDVGACEGLRRIANMIPDIRDTPLVILVDQFEEVYSLCKEPEQRQAFINNLLHAASEPTGEVSVVITLRSDFLGETQRQEQLNQVIGSDQSAFVPAMTTEELRRAIAEPAEQAGRPLDDATIDLLVQDAKGREGALPLLQFALARIWDGLSQGKTPATTYREMGGVGGALAGEAQKTYDRLSDAEKKIAQRVFVGLVQLGEGTRDTRRRVSVKSLIAKQDTPETVRQVIRQFSTSTARLITLSSTEGQDIAEVTHEALFEHWQQLNDWLDSSRDDIRFHRRLETVAQYWEDKGRADGLLWRAPDLGLLRTYQQRAAGYMTDVEIAFWQASDQAEQALIQAEKRRKQVRQLATVGFAIGFLLTSLSTGVAVWNVQKANRKTREANLNNIKALAQSASTLNADGKTFEALNVALRTKKRFHNYKLTDTITLNQIKGEFYSALFQLPSEVTRFEDYSDGPRDAYSDDMTSVRFSPDGKSIATASFNGTAKLWKIDGLLITTLEGHSGWVWAVSFSPGGNTIATASRDGTAKLWNKDGSLLHTLAGHSDEVWAVNFSPDGNTIVTASRDGTAKLWNKDGSLLHTLAGHSGWVWAVSFSPDGNTIATASRDGTAKLWDKDGSLLHTLEGHSDEVGDVSFSPDGNTIATASRDGTAKLWNKDGSLLHTLEGHSDEVWAVSFSPDGKSIATASRDGIAKLWNMDGSLIHTLAGHSDEVRDVRFSLDGKSIATASHDGTAKLWKIDDFLIHTLEGHSESVPDARFSPDGKTFVTASWDGTAKLWKTDDGTLIDTLEGHSERVEAVSFSPDSKSIATASRDGTAKLWQVDGTLINTLEGHSDAVMDVSFSPDGETIATASWDGSAKLWQANGTLIHTLKSHSAPLGAVRFGPTVQFSPDSNTIATATYDGTTKLWRADGTLLYTLEGHSDAVFDVRFSPDGNTIATTDGTTKLWNTNDGKLLYTLAGHSNEVSFSPDGKSIATASRDGTAKLWNTNDGRLLHTLEGHSNEVWDVRFNPDGKSIATASRDGTAKLWNTDGSLIYTLEGHSNSVSEVRFSSDGNIIATVSSDGDGSTVKLWPLSLDVLIPYGCQSRKGYLLTSPNVLPEDRQLCD